ncbi:unnamed protein product [Strongylus vulgaris]|uniref:Dienelactone hydrolase domain-containing protein n=1 Tax=Strongylus vulgaris TaxID=40348 RepID=A0A3P7K1I5_STRVU|nr:unnamed protein product [Strongylus vulgaris]
MQFYVYAFQIGCTGYCFGGLNCLDLARFNVGLQAAVSFHGTLTNYPGNNTEREADWHFTYYADAQHAFTVPGRSSTTKITKLFFEIFEGKSLGVANWGIPGAAYNEKADKRSHRAMEGFLAEKLL